MAVPLFLQAIEDSSLSSGIREASGVVGFYLILTFHTIGLALLVGPNAMIDLRLLGLGRDIPLAPFGRWFKIMWAGFWINAISGFFLLLAYPTKALTNPMFYVKLTLVGLAVWTMQRIHTHVFRGSGLTDAASLAKSRSLALLSLFLWTGAITAGRLLAYTFTYILYGVKSS